ncbi:hypothetical protein CBW65_18975 [Tumebacillus avium]|uniref:Amino acid transporter n=1 Tax=Tumebacillus avium TaxID=1903704 RepID=A0A1Y0ITX6_9BACL|nr:hypothetical protein [Tumebacillus avium]ARU62823.1 hypothetical protein CBW65_18975 [Tumebacillus avium]
MTFTNDLHSHPDIRTIRDLMQNFPHPWFLAGGWALDVAGGRVYREHEDLDICIYREHMPAILEYFADWQISVAIPGEHRLEPGTRVEDTLPPRYGLHLHRGEEFLEILLTDREGDIIPFRRNTAISMPRSQFERVDAAGLPYVAPEWQLLYKAKEGRAKDEEDFQVHVPMLTEDGRVWLLRALSTHLPGHPWILKLSC